MLKWFTNNIFTFFYLLEQAIVAGTTVVILLVACFISSFCFIFYFVLFMCINHIIVRGRASMIMTRNGRNTLHFCREMKHSWTQYGDCKANGIL